MSRRLIATGAILLAALPGAALEARGASPSPAPAVAATASPQAVQSLLDSYVASGKVPGIVVAIGWGDAAPVFIHAGKISDDTGAPDTGPDSLWRIYSMTKPITAIAAMMLVEQGKIGLDQPVSDFIPAFKAVRVLDAPETSLASHRAGRPVTVRHLLTHSGGLAYQFLVSGPVRKEYERLGLLGGRADAVASKAQPATLAEFADRVASVPLLAEPGTRWNYSVGVDVLGRVIEVASGEPFDRFVQTRVLKPLGNDFHLLGRCRNPKPRGCRLPMPGQGNAGCRSTQARRRTGCIRHDFLMAAPASFRQRGIMIGCFECSPGHGSPRQGASAAAGDGEAGSVEPAARGRARRCERHARHCPCRRLRRRRVGLSHRCAARGERRKPMAGSGAAGTIAFHDPVKGLRVTVMTNYFPANKWAAVRRRREVTVFKRKIEFETNNIIEREDFMARTWNISKRIALSGTALAATALFVGAPAWAPDVDRGAAGRGRGG